jgi:hypothetical protein
MQYSVAALLQALLTSPYSEFLMDEFIETTELAKASALLSSIPRLYNSPRGERKKPKYMSLFFL